MEAQSFEFYLVRHLNGITYTLEPVSFKLTQNSLEDLILQLTKLSMGKKTRMGSTLEAFVRTIMMQKMVVSVVSYLPLQISVCTCTYLFHGSLKTQLTASDRRRELFSSLPRLSPGSKTTQTPHRHATASEALLECLRCHHH